LTDPTTYAALQQKKVEAQLKIAEEQGKPVTTPPGAVTNFAPGDPRATGLPGGRVSNDTGFIQTGVDPNTGQPIFGARGRATIGPDGQPVTPGGKGPNGKTPATVYDEAGKQIDVALKGDTTLVPRAHQIKDAVLRQQPTLGAGEAAAIATDAVLHPENVKPDIDPRTGAVINVYTNPAVTQTRFTIGAGPSDPKAAIAAWGKDGADAMKTQTQKMLEAQPAPLQEQIKAAAKDDGVLKDSLGKIMASDAPDAIKRATAQAFANKVAAYRGFVMQNKGLFDTVADAARAVFAKPSATSAAAPAPAPKPAAPPAAAAPGGLPVSAPGAPAVAGLAPAVDYAPNSPAARAAANRQQNATAELDRQMKDAGAAQIAQRKISQAFNKDVTTLAPADLVRKYDSLRAQLPTPDRITLQSIERKL
jgi:hypothetical protein